MSAWEKLLNRILNLDKNMRIEELQKVLEAYGYEAKRPKSGSSHMTFRKAGSEPITVPIHQPIKVIYVKLVRDVVLEQEVTK